MDLDMLKEKSLHYHQFPHPGKLTVGTAKPCEAPDDLSLAYTPGVAYPCLAIQEDREKSFDYTMRGNTVAVATDGTAVLGLGNIGSYAALPVMEGKCMLFKKFSGINGIPLAIQTQDPNEFIRIVEALAVNYGGINLEDIKAPECFYIEAELQNRLDIPVFHDDQHGTAVIVYAALLNSLLVIGKTIEIVKIVINGAGAAGIACARFFAAAGVPRNHMVLIDSKGVVATTRNDLNIFKRAFAVETEARSLAEALSGADVFIGVSCAGVLTESLIGSMNRDPIIFALANPDPEILPQQARAWGARIIATGRSDFPNQVNNALGFPGIFRGMLDVRAKRITLKMKLAAAQALANLVGKPTEEYIIPNLFDERVVPCLARAVAESGMKEGVTRAAITDLDCYEEDVARRVYS